MSGNVTCSWVACLRSFCAAIRMSAAFLRAASDSMGHPPRLSDPVTVHTTKSKGGLVRLLIALLRLHLLDLFIGEPQHPRQRRAPRRHATSTQRNTAGTAH